MASLGVGTTAIAGGAAAQPSFGGWMADANNYDGVVDETGTDTVTVEVGAVNGLAFGPAAVRIDPGTTVEWEWTGNGGGHNVHAQDGADFESEMHTEAGQHFSHTFEEDGIVTYQCDPHVSAGMKGVVVVGDVEIETDGGDGGTGDGATGRPAFGSYVDDANVGSYRDARGQSEVTVAVGAGNGLAFDPTTLWIDPGTTVRFEWTGQGGGHNVVANDGPADLDSGSTVSEAGVNYEYTFEEGGITTYYCEPHEAAGMKGAVAVGSDVPMQQTGGNGGGLTLPTTDFGTLFLGTILGLTGLAAAIVLAAEAYGSSWSRGTADEAEQPVYEEPDPEEGIVRRIGHDDFDPIGTATLIAVYLAILVGMWIFMYFVEFLNNGPTVIG